MSITVKAPKSAGSRRPRRLPLVAAAVGVLVVVLVLAGFLIAATSSHARVLPDGTALARVDLPFGGGTVTRVEAFRASDARPVGVTLRGRTVWPTAPIGAGERLTVYVTVKRPGWVSWLSGATKQVKLSLVTPTAALARQYVTVRPGQPLEVAFRSPVRVFGAADAPGRMTPHTLAQGTTSFSVPIHGPAGTLTVVAAPRTWERPARSFVSWFPAGTAATAVVTPALGSTIDPTTPISLTFSKPIAQALGGSRPTITPATPGTWRTTGDRTLTFVPSGYGYGLGAAVALHLPSAVRLLSGNRSSPVGNWSVPAGTTLRLQQILAGLGYLPLTYTPKGAPAKHTLAAEEDAAIHTPAGSFAWRYPNTPADLQAMWQPGTMGELTTGAIMRFESDQGLATDGDPGPLVWKALFTALIAHEHNAFGYTFVDVSEGSPETESTWHDGQTVVSGLVNTGAAGAATQTGTFAVFEHLRVTTMIGQNPDGTKYDDPGIPWVSYFNEGDALHGYLRSSYGFPQSNGCVEMPYSEAAQVWPYTPVGTIVNVKA